MPSDYIYLTLPAGGINRFGLNTRETLLLARIYNQQTYSPDKSRPAPGYADTSSGQLCSELGISQASMKVLKNRLIQKGLLFIVPAHVGHKKARLHFACFDLSALKSILNELEYPNADEVIYTITKRQQATLSKAQNLKKDRRENLQKNRSSSKGNAKKVNTMLTDSIDASKPVKGDEGIDASDQNGKQNQEMAVQTVVNQRLTASIPPNVNLLTDGLENSKPEVETHLNQWYRCKVTDPKIINIIYYLNKKLIQTFNFDFEFSPGQFNYPYACVMGVIDQTDLPEDYRQLYPNAATSQMTQEICDALQTDIKALGTANIFDAVIVNQVNPCKFAVLMCYLPVLAHALAAAVENQGRIKPPFPPDLETFTTCLAAAVNASAEAYKARYETEMLTDLNALANFDMRAFNAQMQLLEVKAGIKD